MADTGPPWNLRFPGPQDFVRETNFYIEDLAQDTAAGLSAAGSEGIGPNVVQAVKLDTFSTTSTSYVDVPDVTVTITPSSATAKVLVMITGVGGNSGAFLTRFQLVRGATPIGNTTSDAFITKIGAVSNNLAQNIAFVFLDSPNSDSATTYKLQVKVNSDTGYVGRTNLDERAATTITAIEVEA